MKNTKVRLLTAFAAAVLMLALNAGADDDVERRAPNFAVENIRGGDVITLANFKDRVVYVDFWASWCGPCLRSFPFMQAMHEEYGDAGLVVIAINLDRNRQDALDFLDEQTASFLIGENAAGDIASDYGVTAMPSSYLVDRDGIIQNVHYGFKSGDKAQIAAQLRTLLRHGDNSYGDSDPNSP